VLHARWLLAALISAALVSPARLQAQTPIPLDAQGAVQLHYAQAAAFMSLNSIATNHLPQQQCMSRAKAAIAAAGFEFFDESLEAVWGRTTSHRDMVAVYCPASHDIALFAAASPTGLGSVTGPLVDRMVEAWQKLSKEP